MPTIEFVNGTGDVEQIAAEPGHTVFETLLANYVPPNAVFVTADGSPVSEFHELESGRRYRATLLEQYDVDRIRALYASRETDDDTPYVNRRITFDADGSIAETRSEMSLDDLQTYVEWRLRDVLDHYDLIADGDDVLVGFSGGIDSSALLLALSAVASSGLDVDVTAITIEDYWSEAGTVLDPESLPEELGVDHHVVTLQDIEAQFGLTGSVTATLDGLRHSEYGDRVVAVANGINRRMFEAYAESNGFDSVAVGDHATDVLAGLLNAQTSGLQSRLDGVPKRQLGDVTYVYPFAFFTKRELALYRYAKTGLEPDNSTFDPWRVNPAEQAFYYYLADALQTYWPGIAYWMIESHDATPVPEAEALVRCTNCGKRKRERDTAGETHCHVCRILDQLEYVT